MKVNEKRKIFGLTMTRRAWNNVLVYVLLLIMVVFWYVAPPTKDTDAPVQDTEVETVGLIPPDGTLTAITVGEIRLVLRDNQWQCDTPCRLPSTAPARIADTWLAVQMEATSQPANNLITSVYFRFEHNEQARIELYAEPELIIRLPNQQQNYRVKNATASQLLGY